MSDIQNESGASASGLPLGLTRLNKFLAQAGVCSRRAADELISEGAVAVNGRVVDTPGAKVNPATDVVTVHGKPAALPSSGCGTYALLNKPVEVVTTTHDPQGRRTVLDVLPPRLRKSRLFPVGRLDYFSEGLLLLTDDGELANRLTHPRYHLPKVYHARVRGEITEDKLKTMRGGMTLAEGEKLAPVRVEILERGGGETLLAMILIQGINRQIRRMCRDLDLTVLRLKRVSQGPIQLGSLKPGEARELTEREIAALKAAAGLGLGAAPCHAKAEKFGVAVRRVAGKANEDVPGQEL